MSDNSLKMYKRRRSLSLTMIKLPQNLVTLTIVIICYLQLQLTNGQLQEAVPTPVGKCDSGRMIVTIPQNYLPFKGLIHARGFRNNPYCFANSSVSSFAAPSLTLNLLAEPNDEDFCGIITLKDGREKAVSIAVRAHSSLELQDDKYFLLTCSNLKTSDSQRRSKSLFREKESEGLIIYDLEKGHSTRSVAVLGKSYYFGPRQPNHMIGNCIAFGSTTDSEKGSANVVQLLDSRGCPTDETIIEVVSNKDEEHSEDDVDIEPNQRFLKYKIKSMFRFPNKDFLGNGNTIGGSSSSGGGGGKNSAGRGGRSRDKEDEIWIDNQVTIQCSSVSCGGNPCPPPCSKESSNLLNDSPATSNLVTTSVNVLNPGLECDHELQHQLTRDWLLALLICVCILLLVMFCVNLFLCSSMACSCTKQEIIDTSSSIDGHSYGHSMSHHRSHSRLGGTSMNGHHKPTTVYDYDPYKGMNGSQSAANLTAINDHQPFYATLQRKPGAIESRNSVLNGYTNNNNTQVMDIATGTSDRRSNKFY